MWGPTRYMGDIYVSCIGYVQGKGVRVKGRGPPKDPRPAIENQFIPVTTALDRPSAAEEF